MAFHPKPFCDVFRLFSRWIFFPRARSSSTALPDIFVSTSFLAVVVATMNVVPSSHASHEKEEHCKMEGEETEHLETIHTTMPQQQQQEEEEEEGRQGRDTTALPLPLVLNPKMQFPLHSRVLIQGLIREAKLNHHLAIVEEFLWENTGRYKCRLLGRKAKQLTRSKHLSIKGENLRLVEPSTFFVNLTINDDRRRRCSQHPQQHYQQQTTFLDPPPISKNLPTTIATTKTKTTDLRVPLHCWVGLDYEDQLLVKLLYADFCDPQTKDDLNTYLSLQHEESDVFDILNAPIDYEEYLTVDQYLEGDEILIMYPKPMFETLYQAMIDYELLEELDVTAHVGLHGDVSLCRLRFPYQLPGPKEPPVYEMDHDDEQKEELSNKPKLLEC